jgi:chromosome segregation ATPase
MSDLEKKSLEAHVDLCAERYSQLNDKLDQMDQRLGNLEITMQDLNRTVNTFKHETVTRYLTWAGVIIATLCGTVGWLASRLI